MTVWVVRHGPVSAEGLCYGRTDIDLYKTDPDACAERVQQQVDGSPTSLWSSPLRRCLGTARVLSARWGLAIQLEPRFQELDYGEWEGRTWKDIEANDPKRLADWMGAWTTAAPPAGETVAQLVARVEAAWQLLPDGAVVISHAGVVRALRVCSGLSWEDAMRGPVPHLVPEAFASFSPQVS